MSLNCLCLITKVFLEVSQYAQENTCTGVSLIKLQVFSMQLHTFFYKQHFSKQCQAEIAKQLSKS